MSKKNVGTVPKGTSSQRGWVPNRDPHLLRSGRNGEGLDSGDPPLAQPNSSLEETGGNQSIENPFEELDRNESLMDDLNFQIETIGMRISEEEGAVGTSPSKTNAPPELIQIESEDENRDSVQGRIRDYELSNIPRTRTNNHDLHHKEDLEMTSYKDIDKVIEAAVSRSVQETQSKTTSLLEEQMKNMKIMQTMVKAISNNVMTIHERLRLVENSTIMLHEKHDKPSTERNPTPDSNGRHRRSSPSNLSHSQGSQQQKVKKLEVYKWGFKFDGTPKSMSVESLIYRITCLQKSNDTSDEEVFANFHHLLSGPALNWYWQYREENKGDELLNYYDVRSELLRQFRGNKRDHEILRSIMDRKQQANESYDEFYGDIRGLVLQMQGRPNEEDLVSIIRSNIRDKVANLIFGCSISSMRDLREECKRAEKHLDTRESRFKKQVSEIDERKTSRNRTITDSSEDEGDRHIAAVQYNRTDRLQMNNKQDKRNTTYKNNERDKRTELTKDNSTSAATCPCASSFHALTCFSCGQGNMSFSCTKCQGNLKVGSAAGVPPSTKIPLPENQNL